MALTRSTTIFSRPKRLSGEEREQEIYHGAQYSESEEHKDEHEQYPPSFQKAHRSIGRLALRQGREKYPRAVKWWDGNEIEKPEEDVHINDDGEEQKERVGDGKIYRDPYEDAEYECDQEVSRRPGERDLRRTAPWILQVARIVRDRLCRRKKEGAVRGEIQN